MGWINAAVPDVDLDGCVDEWGTRLLGHSPQAMPLTTITVDAAGDLAPRGSGRRRVAIMSEFTHAESVHVAASPQQVYETVSDVTRTGEWSPICVGCEWEDPGPDGAAGPRVGARFTGHNRKPDREWSTTGEVVAADPGRAFAWEINGGLVFWGYAMEPEGDGTRLTETWEFRETGREFFRERFGDDADREIAIRQADARSGIPATLAAIKRVVEDA